MDFHQLSAKTEARAIGYLITELFVVFIVLGRTNSTEPSLSPSPARIPLASRVGASTPGYGLR